MDGAFFVVVYLLASMGVVSAFGWLRCVFARPKSLPDSYTVIPLCVQPAALEQQIRYELACRRWSMWAQRTYLVFVDNGMDDECQQICGHLLDGVYGVFICTPDLLGDTLNAFSHLQEGRQGI